MDSDVGRLALYGSAYYGAVLGPGAVVVADLGVAEKLGQHEPGVSGALADAAVGDDLVCTLLPDVHSNHCLFDGIDDAGVVHALPSTKAILKLQFVTNVFDRTFLTSHNC